LVYDLELAGVSIIKAYRNEYSEFLREKTFEQLLKTLKNK
ncbi:MAG: ABC transporter substrate-binding protein, partial [Arcobacter sp.]|nr:ABC transporter substrate-binding protein [Arcobacter sp.]